jgi:beta-lactamase regulating signal transducer with metallopeptidase domain/protocatechuate 3,4-dioxygenase beta subunit
VWTVGVWIAAAWAVLVAVGLLRLLGSFALASQLMARASSVGDPAILAAAAEAARSVGLTAPPEVRESGKVRCPVVWCWGRRPLLIVPTSPRGPAGGRAAIYCHELAHWKRGDHLASLVAEVLTCVMPWQPLAWMLRGRMADLAEMACDDWALAHARVVSPDDYAEALLGLAVGARRPLVPAAVSSRSGLISRIRHILKETQPMPRSGRLWCFATTALALGLVMVLALAQTRQARAVPPPPPVAPRSPVDLPQAEGTMVEGMVRDPQGQPIAGAEVLWVGASPPELSHVAMPHDDPRYGKNIVRVLTRGVADGGGRFTLRAKIEKPTSNGPWSNLLIHKPGFAPTSAIVALDGKPINATLAPPVAIVGRLLNPAGDPAAGVVVRLDGYSNGRYDDIDQALMMNYGERTEYVERPPFFPGEFRTDEDGRFTIAGFVPAGAFATVELKHPDYAAEELTVATGDNLKPTPALEAFSIRPLPREFTHTLGPARPVVGQVTDAETRQPLAGIAVEVTPMRRHGGMPVWTRTDADGRYRVADRDGQMYFVKAIPSAGSGYLTAEQNGLNWPLGAAELRVNLALRRGLVLRGKVVDEDSGRPIPGCGVVYQPKRGNKDVRDSDDFRDPTLTDADGRFALTGLRGAGVIVAEGPSLDYIRHTVAPVDFGMQTNMQVHGLTRFEVPAEGDAAEVVVKLRKGFTLEAQAVTPDGKPLHVRGWCPELGARLLNNWFSPSEFADGRFRLPGAESGRTYRVFLLSHDQKFAKVAEIQADPSRTAPVEVRLEPTASFRGRVVDNAGAPVEGSQVLLNMQLVDKGPRLTERGRFNEFEVNLHIQFTGDYIKQAYPAEFDYRGLFPGIRYFVTWYTQDGKHEWRAIEPLRPGEIRTVGDIRSERREGDKDEK